MTSVLSSIVGLAYVGLFVLMAIGAGEEITTIQEFKDKGAQVTNTDEDLAASIAENELAIVVFYVGAATTIPLIVASMLAFSRRSRARTLATSACSRSRRSCSRCSWSLPATTRAMVARRWRRTAVQGLPPMPGWQGGPPMVTR